MNLHQRAMIGLVAATACAGLLIEADLSFAWMLARGVTLPDAVIRFFSYFTVLTNTMIALYGVFCMLGGESRWGGAALHASLKTGLAVSIFFVALGYTALLKNFWHLTGLAACANTLLHYVVPALFLLYWVFFASRRLLPWMHACWWTLYPGLYFFYALIQGRRTGLYPYPFIDAAEIGYRHALANGMTLLVLYWLAALLFIAMARLRLPAGEWKSVGAATFGSDPS
jgi:hypothetical protein